MPPLVAYVLDDSLTVSQSWVTFDYDTELLDPLAFHDNTTNPTRLTVPSGLGGHYFVCARANNDAAAGNAHQGCRVRKNGATVTATQENYGASAAGIDSIVWDVLELASGDYLEIQAFNDKAPGQNFSSTCMLIGIPGSNICHAKFSGSSSKTNNTWSTVDLTEVIDTDGLHSDVTNPSRITAQQSGNYVVLAYGGWTPANGGSRGVRITKNGTEVGGTRQHLIGSTGGVEQGTPTWAIVSLSAGDYVETEHFQSSGANLNLTSSRLAVFPITGGANCGYANGTGTAALSANTWTTLNLANEQIDVGGWHDNSTNPSRFTCQTDGTYFALCNTYAQSPQVFVGARFTVNGTFVGENSGSRGTNSPPISGANMHAQTLIVGDYLEIQGYEGDLGDTFELQYCAILYARIEDVARQSLLPNLWRYHN